MAFAADPNRADFLRIDLGPSQGIASRFQANCQGILVRPRYGFLLDGQATVTPGPNAGDFFGGQTIFRDITAVTDNTSSDRRFH